MKKRLLIVEDSDFSRDLLVQIFEQSYRLDLARDGETAVQIASTHRPDLILMDIGLPRLTGIEAVRVIRTMAPGLPIIAVSSHVMPGDRERAFAAGCNGFVAKPIDDLLLADMVGSLLEAR